MRVMIYRFTVLCCLALAAMRSSAQDDEIVDGYPRNWQAPRLYELIRSTEQQGPRARAEEFVSWMQANDWTSIQLELRDAYNLYDKICVDVIDSTRFSARWTGFLTSDISGTCVLSLARDFSDRDGELKVSVDGKLILSPTDTETASRFSSSPIRIEAGIPLPVQIELVHDVPPPIGIFSSGAPMVMLSWKLNDQAAEIVPASAFSPPQGFAANASNGLKGEYFRDNGFAEPVAIRLDPALDFAWTFPPVVCAHSQLADACLKVCKDKLLDGEFLSQSASNGDAEVFDYNLWRVAYRMSGSERLKLVDTLRSRPEVLSKLSTGAVARLMQAVYMLPEKEHLDLIGEWSVSKPQPRSKVGAFPGWDDGSYQQLNTDFYWLMGLFLQGAYWQDVETLCDRYLTLPNGECNLHIAYLAAYATRAESYNRDARHWRTYLQLLQGQLDDETVTGDKRLTWLLARAFASEIASAKHPKLDPTSDYLVEARLVAESTDYRFWALQEAAVRSASMGRSSQVEDLLGEFEGDTPDQRAAIANWREKASTLKQSYGDINEERAAQSAIAFTAELERRRAQALQKQNASSAARYQRLIQSESSNREQ